MLQAAAALTKRNAARRVVKISECRIQCKGARHCHGFNSFRY
jgi:hypothetical protein